MRKVKIYLETTIFNYYFDTERDAHAPTVKLFQEIKDGRFEAFTSAYVVEELAKTRDIERRKNMLNLISKYEINLLDTNDVAEQLADEYVKEGIIPTKYIMDGVHIALASIKEMDFIISLNFAHINKAKTKIFVPHINKLRGFDHNILIFSPMEVIDDENK